MPVVDAHAHKGGPVPKFKDYHIWKALYILNQESPIGRKGLASLLGVGEGSTRTILSCLQDTGNIIIRKNGVALTPEGKKLWNVIKMDITQFNMDALTIGKVNCAVRVPHAAEYVKYGCEERDTAIKSGATGATTLIYSNGIFVFPGNDYPLEPKADKALKSSFNMVNGDVVILGTADTYEAAEEGAVTAGIELRGGLRLSLTKEKKESASNLVGDLIALAFMVHDLVGGLPVCAKSKDNLGIRIENGAVIDNAYTGAVMEEVLNVGTTIRRIATSGPYKGTKVIVTPLEVNNEVIAAIGVVDVRSMAGINNLIRLHEDDEL